MVVRPLIHFDGVSTVGCSELVRDLNSWSDKIEISFDLLRVRFAMFGVLCLHLL